MTRIVNCYRIALCNMASEPGGCMNNQVTEIIYKTSHLQGVIIEQQTLTMEVLLGMNISTSLIHKARYQQVVFSECNFNCTEFRGVVFENCVFANCTFEFSHFRHCQFKNCNFTDCKWISSGMQKSLFEECQLDSHVLSQINCNENLDLSSIEDSFENRLLALVA